MTDGTDPMAIEVARRRQAMAHRDQWIGTEEAAREIGGVTARWLRMQILNGNLPARTLLTGRRVTYRIRQSDLKVFMARFIREAAPLR
jgi:hypothetical protein